MHHQAKYICSNGEQHDNYDKLIPFLDEWLSLYVGTLFFCIPH